MIEQPPIEKNMIAMNLAAGKACGAFHFEGTIFSWVFAREAFWPRIIIGAAMSPAKCDLAIGKVNEAIGRGIMPTGWSIFPWSTPIDLPARLAARSWVEQDPETAMTKELGDDLVEVDGEFPVARVSPGEQASQWATIFVRHLAELPNIEMSKFLHAARAKTDDPRLISHLMKRFVPILERMEREEIERLVKAQRLCARDERFSFWAVHAVDRVVSIGTLFLDGETAGVYHVATDPAFRGRGLAKALTAKMLAHARARGCSRAVLGATREGVRLYRSLGFAEMWTIRNFSYRP